MRSERQILWVSPFFFLLGEECASVCIIFVSVSLAAADTAV